MKPPNRPYGEPPDHVWYLSRIVGLMLAMLAGLLLVNLGDAYFNVAHGSGKPPCVVYLDNARAGSYTLLAVKRGKEHGRMRYFLEDNTATVEMVYVHTPYREQHVSLDLFRHMLAREPEATQVAATLILDNFDATLLRRARNPVDMAACARAIMMTPFYKAFYRLGFAKIQVCRYVLGMESVQVEIGRGI